MKDLNIYVISIVAVIGLFFNCVVQAQSVAISTDNGQIVDSIEYTQDHNKKERSSNTIVEEDFSCYRNIECLQNGSFIDKKNYNLEFRNMNQNNKTHYVLIGHGFNIEVDARYDSDGNLVDATLIKQDTQIPVPILKYIYSDDEFTGWIMTENEMIVKDFDSYQTEYKVTLTNGNEEQVLHFREQGEMIALVD